MRVKLKNKESVLKSAVDIALEENQLRALNMIINYIVQYQNNFAFNFLFKDIFIDLLEKGIKLRPVLESNIFQYEFNDDRWPKIHSHNMNVLTYYNGPIFKMNDKYEEIFPMIPENEINKIET